MNTDLHVAEIGHGEAIVFIHGAFDAAEETFSEQMELADEYRVALVGRRGCARALLQSAWTSRRRWNELKARSETWSVAEPASVDRADPIATVGRQWDQNANAPSVGQRRPME
jgi:pimeloyl-ACP methyl ester carboxylesterase